MHDDAQEECETAGFMENAKEMEAKVAKVKDVPGVGVECAMKVACQAGSVGCLISRGVCMP